MTADAFVIPRGAGDGGRMVSAKFDDSKESEGLQAHAAPPQTPEEYRSEARRLRERAEQIRYDDVRRAVLSIADLYESLARKVAGLKNK